MPDDVNEFDLVMRSSVDIDAPPEVVWEVLERFESWKASVERVERIAGERDSPGELLKVAQRAGERLVYVTHRTIECTPPAWKVQWLETEDGRSTRGYLVYSLAACDGGTRLVGELLARAALPGLPDAEASRMIHEATRAKFHADHLALKRLVENG